MIAAAVRSARSSTGSNHSRSSARMSTCPRGQRRLLGLDPRAHPLAERLQVGALVAEDRGRVDGCSISSRPGSSVATEPGIIRRPLSGSLLAHVLEVHGLVGEDVRRVVAEIVEAEQVVVEEARRAGHRDRPSRRRPAASSGASGPSASRASCGRARSSSAAGSGRPSGTRSRPRTGRSARRSGRTRASPSRSTGRASFWSKIRTSPSSIASAESPSGPSAGKIVQTVITRSAVELERHVRLRLDEAREAERLELAVDEVERVVGEDHGRVLRDVVAQEVAVEVVAVDVRDVEVVGAAERRPGRAPGWTGTAPRRRSTPG